MEKIYEEPEITVVSFEAEEIMSHDISCIDWDVVTGPEAIEDY